ncbi:MAG: c-type cytochrome biogenesis protein CcmI [Rhodobacteraceae bacterium]|nr:c-type cytochrome biogenesis protein CcmI [Paracoccaceae bacterium]
MENAGFWAIAGLMAFGVAALLILSLLAARRATLAPVAAEDLQIYRDQLREVDRDIARGTLADAEGQRLQTEIARRLLEADRKVRTAGGAAGAGAGNFGGVALAAAAILLAAVAALWLYAREGLPGYPDLPIRARLAEADARMAGRPAQADYVAGLTALPAPEITPDYQNLIEELRAKVDPATATDPRGLALLAQNEARLGNFETALAAQRRLIAVLGPAASADDHAQLAEILVMQAQGYVSPEAELALIEALKREPVNGRALYYSGLMFAQSGRYDRAFVIWRDLLEKGPQDAPWVAALRGQLVEVADLAGVPYSPPPDAAPAGPGPDASDMAAAADMTPEARQEMIEGMVGQLSDRLAREGGPAEDWAQLIRALGVLGRSDEARAIYDEARTRFTGRDADLAAIAAAAADAGLTP